MKEYQLKNKDIDRMQTVLFVVVNIIIKATIMLYPVIPSSSSKVLSFFNLEIENNNFNNFNKLITNIIKINSPTPVFPRID